MVVDGRWELSPGTSAQWADEDTLYFTAQPSGKFSMWWHGGVEQVRDYEFNQFTVGGPGRWAGYSAARGGVEFSNGTFVEGWSGPALSADESVWAALQHATGRVHTQAGTPAQHADRDCRDLRWCGRALVWNVFMDGRWQIAGMRDSGGPVSLLNIDREEFWPVPFLIGSELWLASLSHTRIVIRPWGATVGYQFPTTTGIFPDAQFIQAENRIRVVWDATRDVLKDERIDPASPRVDLTQSREPNEPIEDTSGQPIDLWPYIVQFKAEAFPRTSSIPTHGHEMHCTFDGRNFHTLPFGESDHWVRMVVEGDTLTFREDRSRDGQNTGDYSFTQALWARRRMSVGDRIVNVNNSLVRYQPDGCQIADVHRFPFTVGLWKRWTSFDCGGDLGWQDVIAYLYDPGGDADTYELSYFAKDYGFFRWEEYDQRTNARRHWTTFNEFGGRAPQPTPGCWTREHLNLTPDNWPPKPPEPPQPPRPPQPPTETRKMASFKTISGHYLCAESGGGREVNATRTAPGPWETFEVIPHEGGIALKANNGQFVCAENGGGGKLNANRDAAGAWERFAVVRVDGGIALQSIDGHFVCAELGGGGEVNVTRMAAGAWETFDAPVLSGTHGGGVSGTRRFVGLVRPDPRGGFMDDTGPVLIVGAHNGDGFTRFCYDPEGQIDIDRITAQAGFDLGRSWFSLGGPWGAGGSLAHDGKDRSVHPWRYPDFEDRLANFITSGATLGIGRHLAGGDFTRETIPDWRHLAHLVRRAIERAGAEHVTVGESLNEALFTGNPGTHTLAEFAEIAYAGLVGVIGLTALGGFDVEAQMINGETLRAANTRPANAIPFHGFRGFGWMNKLERDWNTSYEWHLGHGIDGEGMGVGRRVSAHDNIHECNAAFFKLRTLLMLACGYISIHMSGPGVISDEGFEPYGSTAGFWDVAGMRDWLPRDAGHFRDVFHGGDNRSFSPRRFYRAIGDTRVEHFLHGDGRGIVIAYGNESAHIPKNRNHTVLDDRWIEEGHIRGRLLYVRE